MKRERKPTKDPSVLCEVYSAVSRMGPLQIGYDPCPHCGKMQQSRFETKEEVQSRFQAMKSKVAAELEETIKRQLGDQIEYTIKTFPLEKIGHSCYRMFARAIKK